MKANITISAVMKLTIRDFAEIYMFLFWECVCVCVRVYGFSNHYNPTKKILIALALWLIGLRSSCKHLGFVHQWHAFHQVL